MLRYKAAALKWGCLLFMVLVLYHIAVSSMDSLEVNRPLERTPWDVYQAQRRRGDDYKSGSSVISLNKTCQKIEHFLLTKIEKTGSSTLAAILARFVIQREPNIMTMTYGGHLDITKGQGQVPGWKIGPRKNDKAEVLIEHARYNQKFFDEHFIRDATLITTSRDAESWFQSAVRFWPTQVGKRSANRVLEDNMMYISRSVLNDQYNGLKTIYHLSQLQWLGFDYSNNQNIAAIHEYIDYIVPRYNVVVLTDHFDASLVLMRRRLCWDHSDIIYISKEVPKYQRSAPLTRRNRKLLLSLEVNLGDQLLYEAFRYFWWNQTEVKSQDFWDEVEYFKSLNADHKKRCGNIIKANSRHVYNATKWSESFTLDQSLCRKLSYNKSLLSDLVNSHTRGCLRKTNHSTQITHSCK